VRKARAHKPRSLSTRFLLYAGGIVAALVIVVVPFAWRFANRCDGRIIEKRISISNTRWNPGLRYYFVVQTSEGPCQAAVPEHVYVRAQVGMFYRNTRGRNELSKPTSLPKALK
jgi:hypothetical protein